MPRSMCFYSAQKELSSRAVVNAVLNIGFEMMFRSLFTVTAASDIVLEWVTVINRHLG